MFRFTIRDVLWLAALVAMGAGWWVDHQNAHLKLIQTKIGLPTILDFGGNGNVVRLAPPQLGAARST